MFTRKEILKHLNAQIKINGHIIGAVAGSGMTARYTELGGVDFLLALSAGRFRNMGRSSYASYFCYGNSNDIVMDLGKRELLPVIKNVPVFFGLFSGDPSIKVSDYLKLIKNEGFAGVVNYPTVSLIDGKFRDALEEEGNSFKSEVEAIRLAREIDLFTIAFVTNKIEAKRMLEAGADIICVHLGLTKGGLMGAKKYISIDKARRITDEIIQVCNSFSLDVLKMIYAGPANTPTDMQYIYRNTACQGYIGGSTFDRIPTEKAVYDAVRAFKTNGDEIKEDQIRKAVTGNLNIRSYVDFVKKYIEDNYMHEIKLGDLALVAHVSASYLSIIFKKEVGCTFTEYLIRFRINKARELIQKYKLSCKEAAGQCGYEDYVQFSKIFKKYTGVTPSSYRGKLRD